jgi:hypothetical protein
MELDLRLEDGTESVGFPEGVHEHVMRRLTARPSGRKRKKSADELWHHFPRLMALGDYHGHHRFQVSELPALITELDRALVEFAGEAPAADFLAAFRRLAVLARERGVAMKACPP